ncbi:peptidase M6 [Streptomyces sp. 549]|uniref:peptidase M6 n=1 Tax=Streptomyces sp. 549 TaxID=3049076 RepID=UPI0024C273D1|nr:peptidase M6 [Streptomyces sp. 549]MDK1475606.1 peptidase M6 [Streptomyces sp. 549]
MASRPPLRTSGLRTLLAASAALCAAVTAAPASPSPTTPSQETAARERAAAREGASGAASAPDRAGARGTPDGADAPTGGAHEGSGAVRAATGAPAGRARPGAGPDISGPCAIAPEPNGWVGVGPYDGRHLRPQGTHRATLVMADFPDLPAVSDAAARSSFFTDYALDHLRQSSYGGYRQVMEPTADWVRMPQPWTAYGVGRGTSAAVMQRYVQDAVDAALAAGTDFAGTDLVFVVADSNVPADPMVSQAHTFTSLSAGGRTLRAAALVFGRKGDSAAWQRGNFVHEAHHLFGLPDLYNTRNGASVEFAGAWDPMSLADRSDLLGWHKWKYGWLDGPQVACVGPGTARHLLKPIGSPDGASIAVVRTGPATALVAEARTRVGLDRRICTEGVLLYTVDSSVPTGRGPVRVVDAAPGSRGGAACGGGRDSAETAELADAPFQPGSRHRVAGVTVEVLARSADGYSVRISS